ncbi:MAG: alcohol dehydrogenase catalytic domain-containing protein [Candidatus Roizmanbacteria bacterium]|nr:alcohol dehydrogenase catalytic domain-containing protein [Candidatus Roizmanbacteria bacterium]
MHAVILTETKGKNNLKYTSIPTPVAAKEHALIRVKYCGINHLDLLIAIGKRPGPAQFPHILGSEIVGTIISIEKNSAGFRTGDTVSVYPWTYCGSCPSCRAGNVQLCDSGGTVGRTTWGGYAEYVSVPIKNLVKIPEQIPLKLIAAITLTGTTAHHLIQRANIADRSTVLVTGATGGVGTLVIQLLRQKQCNIVAVTSSKNKVNKLKKLGVHTVFDLKKFSDNVKTNYPAGIPLIIDMMGGSVWSALVELLAKGGTMSFCSTTLDEPGIVHVGSAFSREINVCGSYGGTMKDLGKSIKSLKKGVIKPQIDSIISLPEVPAALSKIKNREVFGKILISM